MNLRKLSIILLILVASSAIWAGRQWSLHQLRRDVTALATARQEAAERAEATAREIEAVRARLAQEKGREQQALAEVAAVERALAKVDPESRWAEPPATTPDWNAESPFVWIRKEMVPRFGVPMFAKSGELEPGVATVLAVDGATMRSLNSQLKRLMTDYHALETAGVKRTDKHLPGAQGDGPKVTVEIPPLPEDGARFKTQFEAVLNAELGDQRASLILQTAEGWLDSQFSGFGTEPKTVSLIRHPVGGYTVCIKSGGSWFSCGVPADRPEMLEYYIPPHLLPLFKDVLAAPGDSPDATQAGMR